MSQETVPPLPEPKSGLSGCLIGCLIVLVAGLIGIGLLGFFAYKTTQGIIDKTMDTAPVALPSVDLSAEEQTAATEKLARLKAVMESGGDEKEFSFTGDEINVLLRSGEVDPFFGKSVYVTVSNGEVRGEVSLDIGHFFAPLQGRYLNGSATFSVSAKDGRLFVFIESLQVKGEDVPPDFLAQIRAENLAKEMGNNPESQAWIAKIREIRVDGDRLVVVLN